MIKFWLEEVWILDYFGWNFLERENERNFGRKSKREYWLHFEKIDWNYITKFQKRFGVFCHLPQAYVEVKKTTLENSMKLFLNEKRTKEKESKGILNKPRKSLFIKISTENSIILEQKTSRTKKLHLKSMLFIKNLWKKIL